MGINSRIRLEDLNLVCTYDIFKVVFDACIFKQMFNIFSFAVGKGKKYDSR